MTEQDMSLPSPVNAAVLRRPTGWASTSAIVAIVLLAAALRLIRLDSVPPAICQDEAVNAYDAYCLRVTGKDHYGAPWPIFFRSFGDFHPGPPIYLQIPFQMLMGMNVWSARLPDALFGVAHVLFVYLLVRRFYGDRVGLSAALLLAVSPWHIHLSRLAFGIGISVSLTTLGILLIVKQACRYPNQQKDNAGPGACLQLGIAGLALGIALWTYHAMRVIVPLLLIGGAVIGLGRLRMFARRRGGVWGLAALAGGLALGLAPFVWAWTVTPDQAWARASSRSLFLQTSGFFDAAKAMLHNYAMHFSPSYLFLEGDLSLVQSIPGYGQLHHFFAPLLLLGLYRVVRRWRTERFGLFVLGWILIGPLPASLTRLDTDSGHCLRSSGVLPAYEMLAAIGLALALEAARRRSRTALRWATAAAVMVIAVSATYFQYQFLVRYPREAAPYFLGGWKTVFEEIDRRKADYDAVIITDAASPHIGIFYLFWNKMDPQVYFKAPPVFEYDPAADFLIQVGKLFFLSSKAIDKVIGILPPAARLLVAEWPGVEVPGRLREPILDADGDTIVILYEVQAPSRPQR